MEEANLTEQYATQAIKKLKGDMAQKKKYKVRSRDVAVRLGHRLGEHMRSSAVRPAPGVCPP